MKIRIIILIFMLAASSLFAKTSHWTIVLAHGDTISNVSLQQIKNDSLTLAGEEFTKSVPIDSIMELRKPHKSSFWKGAKIGTLSGIAAGCLFGLANTAGSNHRYVGDGLIIMTGGVLGGVAGFTVGGIIGACSKDRVYDLSQETHVQKYNIIYGIINKKS